MRKLLILTLGIFLLSSCNSIGEHAGMISNPLSEWVMTDSSQPGREVFIQWNGFESDAQLFIKGADGNEINVEIVVITSSGLIFKVPANLTPGHYAVILKQSETFELGTIEVLESSLTVTGIKVPVNASPGETMLISGIGFDSSHSIVLKSSDGTIEISCEPVPSGLYVHIPAGIASGEYALYLTDGAGEWMLLDSVLIAVKKRLVSVKREDPYEGDMKYMSSYSAEYKDGEYTAIIYSVEVVENGEVLEVVQQDRYALGDDLVYRADGGYSSSNNFNFGYVRDSEGKILSADVLRYSRNNPEGVMREFTWVYDAQGIPSRVTYDLNGKTYSMQVYLFSEGNLVDTNANTFVYDGSHPANPFAPDVAHVYDMMSNTMEPFLYAPLLEGDEMFKSLQHPCAFELATGATTTKIVPFTYVYDEDGYPVELSWDSGEQRLVLEYMTL